MNTPIETVPADHLRLVGGLTTLVAVGLPVAAILTADARDVEVAPGAVDWIFVGLVASFTIATFAYLVPWILRGGPRRTARSAITLSASALVLASTFFWTMVPVAFGTAGSYLAWHERRLEDGTRPGRGLTVTATVLGTIAALGSVVAYVATS